MHIVNEASKTVRWTTMPLLFLVPPNMHKHTLVTPYQKFCEPMNGPQNHMILKDKKKRLKCVHGCVCMHV